MLIWVGANTITRVNWSKEEARLNVCCLKPFHKCTNWTEVSFVVGLPVEMEGLRLGFC